MSTSPSIDIRSLRAATTSRLWRIWLHPVTQRTAQLAMITLIAAFFLLVASMQAANARPDDGNGGMPAADQSQIATERLPVSRWGPALTQFHTRTGGLSDLARTSQLTITSSTMGLLFSMGTSCWTTAAQMAEFAYRFNILDKTGAGLDKAAAGLGDAVLSSPLPIMGLVITVVLILWRAGRQGFAYAGWGQFFRKVAVIAVLTASVAGAQHSTGSSEGNYSPGMFSPGWAITKIDKATTLLAEAPAKALAWNGIGGAEKIGREDTAPEFQAPAACFNYVKTLKDNYQEKQRGLTNAPAGSSVPVLISSMWEQTGLQTWIQYQFGDNPHARYMYCRYLEARSGIPYRGTGWVNEADSRLALSLGPEATQESYNNQAIWSQNVTAWRQLGDQVMVDRWILGWAACRNTALDKGTRQDLWKRQKADWGTTDITRPLLKPDDKDTPEDCRKFFAEETETENTGFDRETDPGTVQTEISEQGKNEAAKAWAADFVLTMHGDRTRVGPGSGFVYVVSGLFVFAVFGLLSLAILFGKITALVVIIGLMAMLVLDLFTSGPSKTVGLLKTYVGISFFLVASQLIVAMIATITQILVTVGALSIPGGMTGMLGLTWVGVAPAAAVLLLHFLFKRAGLPSPFSAKGAMGWGKALGGAAGMMGAGGAGAGAMGRMMDGAKRRGGSLLKDSFTPGGQGAGGNSSAAGERKSSRGKGFLQQTAAAAVGSEIAERVGDDTKQGKEGGSRRNEEDAANETTAAGGAGGKEAAALTGAAAAARSRSDQFAYATRSERAAAIRALRDHQKKTPSMSPGTFARIGGGLAAFKRGEISKRDVFQNLRERSKNSLKDRRTLMADGIRRGTHAFVSNPMQSSRNAARWAARKGIQGAAIGAVGTMAIASGGIVPAAMVGGALLAGRGAHRSYMNRHTKKQYGITEGGGGEAPISPESTSPAAAPAEQTAPASNEAALKRDADAPDPAPAAASAEPKGPSTTGSTPAKGSLKRPAGPRRASGAKRAAAPRRAAGPDDEV